MESSTLGVIVDSSVLIDAERQRLTVPVFLRRFKDRIGPKDIALCSISVAELAYGIHRADNAVRRLARRAFLDDLKAAVPIYGITDVTAELVGKINAESSRTGIVIPFDDLLIGACALERSYAVATRNTRHFGRIPGLQLIDV